MLLHFTGSGHFNRSLRSRADKMVCHTLCVCFDFSMSVGVFVYVLVCLSVCVCVQVALIRLSVWL